MRAGKNMRVRPNKIAALLLISMLLTVSLADAFSLVACECGVFSDTHQLNHPTVGHHDDLPEDTLNPVVHALPGLGDTCHDFQIQLSKYISEESENLRSPKITAFTAALPPIAAATASCLPARSEAPLRFPPDISPTLLAHRTVVLLN